MTIKLNFRQRVTRFAALVVCLIISAALLGIALTHFAFAALTNSRLPVSRGLLLSAASYFPNSSRTQARLAAHLIESEVDSTLSHEQVAEQAVYYATHAVKRSPRNYELWVISALAKEAQGDFAGAENDLRAALALAPHQLKVHWRLANLLVRAGKLDQAIPEFQIVNAGTAGYLSETMNLVWQASDGDVAVLRLAIGDESSGVSESRMPETRIALARFLASQAQFDASMNVFRSLSLRQRLDLPETPEILDELLAAGRIELAAQLWHELFNPEAQANQPLIWNGGFETTIKKGFTQFDWNLAQSKFAQISLTTSIARSGHRALEISYLGIDTTRLEDEIRQRIPVRPGARYRLEAFAKTEELITQNAPGITIFSPDSKKILASSPLVETGSHGWQPLAIEFTTPSDARAIIVAITQKPLFSYVEPTQGTVWFDDFTLQQK